MAYKRENRNVALYPLHTRATLYMPRVGSDPGTTFWASLQHWFSIFVKISEHWTWFFFFWNEYQILFNFATTKFTLEFSFPAVADFSVLFLCLVQEWQSCCFLWQPRAPSYCFAFSLSILPVLFLFSCLTKDDFTVWQKRNYIFQEIVTRVAFP